MALNCKRPSNQPRFLHDADRSKNSTSGASTSGASHKAPIKKTGDNPNEILTEEDMRLCEQANIEPALKHTDWKIYGTGGAAELFGLTSTTLLSP